MAYFRTTKRTNAWLDRQPVTILDSVWLTVEGANSTEYVCRNLSDRRLYEIARAEFNSCVERLS
jgi:hypothetical protein